MSDTASQGDPHEWVDLQVVDGLFTELLRLRPTWLQLADAAHTTLVERGHRPTEPERIVTAEVRAGSDLLGTVSVAASTADADGSDGAPFAEMVARLIAEAAYREVELESLTNELMDKYEEVTLLLDLSRAFRSDLDVDALSAVALEQAVAALEPERAWVAIAADGEAPLQVTAVHGPGPDLRAVVARGSGAAGLVAARREPLLLHPGEQRSAEIARWAGAGEALLGVAIAPEEDGEVDGAIIVVDGSSRRFTAGENRLLATIAAQLGSAVRDQRRLLTVREAERVQQELDIAASIQLGLLPQKAPSFAGTDLAGLCLPAASVGGDYYDLYVDRQGRLAVVIADVAGHSISSALLMTAARGVLRAEMLAGHAPNEVLAATNETLHDDLAGAGLFITIFCGRLDAGTGVFEYANGGQTLPILARADGTVEELDADGLPAGFLPEADFELGQVPFGPGDRLLLMTDGVVEARGPDDEMFGEARAMNLVASHEGDAQQLVDAIHDAVGAWTGGRPQADDITLVGVVGLHPTASGS